MLTDKGQNPELFVYAKLNTRDKNWPYTETAYLPSGREMLDHLLREYLERLHYTPLWQNSEFVIYGKPHYSSPMTVLSN